MTAYQHNPQPQHKPLALLLRCTALTLTLAHSAWSNPFVQIIDNEDLDPATGHFFELMGGWEGPSPGSTANNVVGNNYRIGHPSSFLINDFADPNASIGPGIAKWEFIVPEIDQQYIVSAQWDARGFQARTAQYTVFHQQGSTTVIVDQTDPQTDGVFVELGRFVGPSRVELSNVSADPSEQQDPLMGFVFADAVKIERVTHCLKAPKEGDCVVFQKDNQIGIGTETPSAALDVAGDIAVNGQVIIDSDGRFVGQSEPMPVALAQRGCNWRNWGSNGEIGPAICPVGQYVAGHVGTGISTGSKKNFGQILCCSPQ